MGNVQRWRISASEVSWPRFNRDMTFLLLRTTFLLLFCALTVCARVGTLETRDGQMYEGHIRFETNSVVVVNPATGLWVQVPLTNLAGLTMERETSPAF